MLRSLSARGDSFASTEADALLERVGMAEQAERPCAVLAYGDLKRVELAVALANRPRLLLMDEPTAGMAPEERDALMQLAADLARSERIAVLFTEHDMDVVFGFADRVHRAARRRDDRRGHARGGARRRAACARSTLAMLEVARA